MAELKKEILVLKETYLKEMEQITVLSQKEKAEAQKKVHKLSNADANTHSPDQISPNQERRNRSHQQSLERVG